MLGFSSKGWQEPSRHDINDDSGKGDQSYYTNLYTQTGDGVTALVLVVLAAHCANDGHLEWAAIFGVAV